MAIDSAAVAIAIAVAVWEPIYGVDNIARQRPLRARRFAAHWFVHGTLPDGWVGGTAEILMQIVDGKIVGLMHGK